jgi:hypothetical protein
MDVNLGQRLNLFGKTYVTLREIYDPVNYFVLHYCRVWVLGAFPWPAFLSSGKESFVCEMAKQTVCTRMSACLHFKFLQQLTDFHDV